jgi:hypothetical protein
VLAVVTIGGGVMGIPGMLIGVPLVAAIYTLVGEDMDERLAARAAASVPPAEVPVPAEPKPEPIKAEESPKPAKSKKKKKKK